jgi:ribulose-5-phosphate 4-epimerase/fuculose-1-phosphate aldolase
MHAEDFHSPTIAGLRADLALALRAAAHHGLAEGICNHFSVELPDASDRFLLNPRGLLWSEIQADDIVLIANDGRKLAGRHEVESTAMFIHAAVHRLGKACVLHTHMPYATALAMTRDGLDTRASQNAMYFHGRIARLAYGGLAEAEEEGARIAQALGEGVTVLLMDNHGVLVVGESVADAWHQLYFLERACQVQVLAQSTGSPLLQVPEDVANHTAAQFRGVGGQAELFAAVRRELDRVNPGYDR